jgi:hypothetical protein
MPDMICTHCRGASLIGCKYCNPDGYTTLHMNWTRTDAGYSNLPDPGEPPLTFDEIRKLRELLAERKHGALLKEARSEPSKYDVKIVWEDDPSPCKPHRRFPCKICGTQHFEGCQCAFCRE